MNWPTSWGVHDAFTRASELHAVAALPHCVGCGDPGLDPPGADFPLTSRARIAGPGGGYRTVASAETLARYAPLVSPLTGVVRHVRRVPVEGADFVHVYTSSHARHFGAASLRAVRSDRRDPAGGGRAGPSWTRA